MFEVFWSPLPDFVADTHPVWLFPFQGGIAWHRTTKQSKHPKQIRLVRSAWEWAALPISSAFISAQRARTPWRTRWSGWCVMMWKQIISKLRKLYVTLLFSILTRMTRRALCWSNAAKCCLRMITGLRYLIPLTLQNQCITILSLTSGAKRTFWNS